MTAPHRLALFDCDGTLVDSQHMIVEAMQDACREQGLPPPTPDSVRQIIGLSLEQAIARLFPEVTPPALRSLAAGYRTAYDQRRQTAGLEEPLYPGALAALDALEAQGILLGIATGKSRRGLNAVLDRPGLRARFVTTQTADDGPGKPNPLMVHRAMAESATEAAGVVMIGDTVFDMQLARAAGIASIGVAWGYHPSGDLTAAGADRIVTAFADLPGAVLALLSV